MNNKSATRAAGLLVLSLGLGACSASDNVDETAIGQPLITDDATQETPVPTRQPTPPREPSPFDEFRNILWSMDMDEEARRRRFDADRVREEDIIAQCMNELGFNYFPFVNNVILDFPNPNDIDPDNPDWVAQFGYGFAAFGSDALGTPRFSMGVRENENPNAEILDELSDGERSAWNNALWNQGAGFERMVGTMGPFRDCFNWARHVVMYERQTLTASEEFAPLMEAIGQMHDDLQWGISDADRAWASCMFDTGFPEFDRQWEASQSFLEQWGQAMTAITSDPEWDSALGRPTSTNSPVMAALQEREVAVATADLNCRATTNFEVLRNEHITYVENQFITDHRAALEALRSAAEQRD